MKTKLSLTILLIGILHFNISAQDWAGIPVPATAGTGKTWELQENVSDDFNYTFNASNQHTNFGQGNKWYNFYHNQWDGPGTTYWKYDHVSVDGNNLVLKASRWDKSNQPNPQYPYPGAWEEHKMGKADNGVNSGCVTSNNKVVYPVFVESAISVVNTALASCFWLLSPDDTQEIDIIENYGGVDGFKHLTHISHHSFIRDPFHDYQPRDWNSWWPDDRVNTNYGWGDWSWNNGTRHYLRLGVYWISPDHFEYYVDGELVRVMYKNAIATRMNGTWEYTYYNTINPANTQDAWGNNIGDQPVNISSGYQTGYSDVTTYATGTNYSFETHKATSDASKGINVVDPGSYQNGTGFTKEMDIIINVESQSWLVSRGATPNNNDLIDPSKNEMKIDWVRVYKPTNTDAAPATVIINNEQELLNTNHSINEELTVEYSFDAGEGNTINGNGVKLWLREMTGDWEVVNDYTVTDLEAEGLNTGVNSISLPLTNIPTSQDLPTDNWYFLYLSYTNSFGTTVDKGISPITIIDPLITSSQTHLNSNLSIYPNPVKTTLKLSFPTEWVIINAQGMIIDQGFGKSINTNTLTPGLYTLQVINGEINTLNFIKE